MALSLLPKLGTVWLDQREDAATIEQLICLGFGYPHFGLQVSECHWGYRPVATRGIPPAIPPFGMISGGIECSTMVRRITPNRSKSPFFWTLMIIYVGDNWCPGEDSNLHTLASTST